MILPIRAILQINPITEEAGYTQIKLRTVEVVNQTSTILHIIDTKELSNIVDQLESNIKSLNLYNREIIEMEIKVIKSKLKTITSVNSRQKRGLFNFIGNVEKWLIGVMDDDDRKEIFEHLDTIDKNNHNIIDTVNKQISINLHFNESISILKSAIEEDRENIKNTIKEFRNRHNEIVQRLLYADQMLKLTYLRGKIEQIQDNIASARNHIFHPGILTSEEIDKFDINFYKLKFVKTDIINYKNGILIIAVKIPYDYIQTELKMLVALPNKNYMEIDEPNGYIIEVDNRVLDYQENVYLKNLRNSKHCTIINNCNFKYNNKTDIEVFEDDMILIKNAIELEIVQDCDDRKIKLNKNYLILFYNCKMKIKDQTFQNQQVAIQDKYYYPNQNLSEFDIAPKKFEPIELKNFENIKEIAELKFHRNISYGISTTFIIIIIIIVIIVIRIKKHTNVINKLEIRNESKKQDLELGNLKMKYGIE